MNREVCPPIELIDNLSFMPSYHAAALKPGFSIKEYLIESVLGQGTFGITYKARDVRKDEYVAIKEYFPREFSARETDGNVIPSGSSEDIEHFNWGLAKFVEEAKTLAKFDHPNIISVKRFFESNGTAYLVMDYCDGEPLDVILQREKTLDESKIREFLKPLLEGLELIHSIGVIHRDIKPGNIFIRLDGSPVLLDFGAARHELSQYSHSRSVTSLATDGYAPIEQYSTRSSLLGPWSDIYAMAATLYRCVAGVKPQGSLDRQLQDELEPISRVAEGKCSSQFLKAIDLGLQLRKEQRPRTVAEWREQFFGVESIWPPVTHSVSEAPAKKRVPTIFWVVAALVVMVYGINLINGNKSVDQNSLSEMGTGGSATIEGKGIAEADAKAQSMLADARRKEEEERRRQEQEAITRHAEDVRRKQEEEKSGLAEAELRNQEEHQNKFDDDRRAQEEFRRKQEEEKRRFEDEKRRQEEARRRHEEELRRIEENKRQQQELAEQRAKARRESDLKRLQSMAGEGTTGDAERSSGRTDSANYARLIAGKIKSHTILPPLNEIVSNSGVEFAIELLPDGSLKSVNMTRSSGVAAFDQAVRRAIDRAAPFPPDPATGKVPSGLMVIHRPKDN